MTIPLHPPATGLVLAGGSASKVLLLSRLEVGFSCAIPATGLALAVPSARKFFYCPNLSWVCENCENCDFVVLS